MKFLSQDLTSAYSASSTLSGFATSNVATDKPKKSWMSASSAATFTVNLACTSTAKAESFFLDGILSNVFSWVLKNESGSTLDSGTLDMSIPAESIQSGNPNNLNTYFDNQAHLLRSFYINFSQDQECVDNGTLELSMDSNINMGGKNTTGNAVASWQRDGLKTGRLLDSDGAAINVYDHGRIFVGSFLTSSQISNPLETNTTLSANALAESQFIINGLVILTIDGSIELTVSSSAVISQIVSITGDGTASSAIELSSDLITTTLSLVYNPIRIGVLRCGMNENFPNPSSGLSLNYTDYSIRRGQPAGGYSYRQRGLARNYTGGCLMSNAEALSMQNLYRAYRSKPIPIMIFEGMPIDFDSSKIGNLFAFFKEPPSFQFISANYQSVSFSLQEVL